MSTEGAACTATGFALAFINAVIALGVVAETIVYGAIGAATAYITSEILKATGISKHIHNQTNKLKQWLKKKDN